MDFNLEKHNPWWVDKNKINEDVVLAELLNQNINTFILLLKQSQIRMRFLLFVDHVGLERQL